ncbi:MAG TPA: hypothetical protein VJZ00_25065 [Thermoanaerobaculia bacterium]|nr:hypothetical protein [Thermoanaerobaculia bacterium]
MATGLILSAMLLTFSAGAAERVLFPTPLHITRELSDPVSQKTTVIDEYCQGNRMISVSGSRTAIADYAKGEMTEIDFSAGTYSVTKFAQIAKLNEKTTASAERPLAKSAASNNDEWRVEARGGAVVASRPVETTEAERKDENSRQVIRVSADRQMTLSRGAVEAIMGIGYPHRASNVGDVLLGALRSHDNKRVQTNGVAAEDEYHLPMEQVFRFETGGESVETRNVVTRIGNELVPAEALTIPPGAKLVESKAVAMQRLLEELDGTSRPSN